ncbi:MAG: YdcF family protein [Deinococcus-Thermus bacterium]|nr:YdcF family protein [Deinococcota bacterium]
MGAAQYDGRPSPAFERRLQEALALHEAGCVARIVVSGGARPGDRSSEGASGVAWLRARGVPDEALAAETTARSSAENLAASRELLGEGPIVIVTDQLHAWRSLWLARRTGRTASAAVAPVRSGRLRYAVRELTAMAAYRLGLTP